MSNALALELPKESMNDFNDLGYSVIKDFIPEDYRNRIHQLLLSGPRDLGNNNQLVTNDPDVLAMANAAQSLFTTSGFSDWTPNTIYARCELRPCYAHVDKAEYLHGAALFYLTGSGITMNVAPTRDLLGGNPVVINAGDVLLLRESFGITQSEQLKGEDDGRMWHEVQQATERSFIHIGYQLFDDIAYSIDNHEPVVCTPW